MEPGRTGRDTGAYSRPIWAAGTIVLAVLTVVDVIALANLARIQGTLPAPLRQPLADLVIIALPLLPAFALRAGERALHPHLSVVAWDGLLKAPRIVGRASRRRAL